MLDRKQNPSRAAAAHEVFAMLNPLHNPRIAAIYLSLVVAEGSKEDVERARELIARDMAKGG